MASAGQYDENLIFGDLWKSKDFVLTKRMADLSVTKHAPMFTKVSQLWTYVAQGQWVRGLQGSNYKLYFI